MYNFLFFFAYHKPSFFLQKQMKKNIQETILRGTYGGGIREKETNEGNTHAHIHWDKNHSGGLKWSFCGGRRWSTVTVNNPECIYEVVLSSPSVPPFYTRVPIINDLYIILRLHLFLYFLDIINTYVTVGTKPLSNRPLNLNERAFWALTCSK